MFFFYVLWLLGAGKITPLLKCLFSIHEALVWIPSPTQTGYGGTNLSIPSTGEAEAEQSEIQGLLQLVYTEFTVNWTTWDPASKQKQINIMTIKLKD